VRELKWMQIESDLPLGQLDEVGGDELNHLPCHVAASPTLGFMVDP